MHPASVAGIAGVYLGDCHAGRHRRLRTRHVRRAGSGRLRQNPYALQSQMTTLQQQQVALAQRNQELQSRATTLDQDNQELQTQLAQTQRQSRLLQDQASALREQLGSTTAQLAQSQQDKQLVERNAQAIVASTKRRAGVTIAPNSSLAQNLPALNLPGVSVRQDGDVVRIEISGDQLFEPGGAQLRPDSATLLDAVAAEIERTYPDQIIGVEGHSDNEPPPRRGLRRTNSRWAGQCRCSTIFRLARGSSRTNCSWSATAAIIPWSATPRSPEEPAIGGWSWSSIRIGSGNKGGTTPAAIHARNRKRASLSNGGRKLACGFARCASSIAISSSPPAPNWRPRHRSPASCGGFSRRTASVRKWWTS